MLINSLLISQTAASGAWSFNTQKLVSSLIRQIIVKAATSTTTFDFTITDNNNNIVYTTDTKATGTLRVELTIPISGICTFAVANSSVDEAFTGKVSIQEVS